MSRTSPRTGEQLHAQRCDMDPIVYELLSSRYLPWLRTWWAAHTLPTLDCTTRAYVMYEMRAHPNMEFVLLSTLYFAGPGTSLIVYCSTQNFEYIRRLLGHNYMAADIRIVEDTDTGREEGRRVYNKTLQSAEFWESIPVEHVILCEMDGYFRRPIPADYWTYDYVCCEWPWHPHLIGGGGTTLRRRSAMIRIAREHPQPDMYAQDVWAANGVAALGLRGIAAFTEAMYLENPVAVHQWWTFVHPELLDLPTLFHIISTYLTLEIPLANPAPIPQLAQEAIQKMA